MGVPGGGEGRGGVASRPVREWLGDRVAAGGAVAVCPCAGAAAAGQHRGAAVRGTQEPRGAPAAGDTRPPRPGRGSTDRPLPGPQRGTPRAAGPCAVQASRGSLALSGCFQVFPHCAFNVSVRKNPKMHLSIKKVRELGQEAPHWVAPCWVDTERHSLGRGWPVPHHPTPSTRLGGSR